MLESWAKQYFKQYSFCVIISVLGTWEQTSSLLLQLSTYSCGTIEHPLSIYPKVVFLGLEEGFFFLIFWETENYYLTKKQTTNFIWKKYLNTNILKRTEPLCFLYFFFITFIYLIIWCVCVCTCTCTRVHTHTHMSICPCKNQRGTCGSLFSLSIWYPSIELRLLNSMAGAFTAVPSLWLFSIVLFIFLFIYLFIFFFGFSRQGFSVAFWFLSWN